LVDDVIYEGVGSSKKAAKNEAAYNALSKGLSKQIPLSFKTANKLDGSNFVGVNSNPTEADRSDFGDYIAQYVLYTLNLIFIELKFASLFPDLSRAHIRPS